MKRAKTHIILFMAVTITVLYTVYIAFHNSAERVNTQIDHAFKSAITEDYNERLAYISYYHPEPTNWDIKMYTIAPSLHQKVKISYSFLQNRRNLRKERIGILCAKSLNLFVA